MGSCNPLAWRYADPDCASSSSRNIASTRYSTQDSVLFARGYDALRGESASRSADEGTQGVHQSGQQGNGTGIFSL